MEGFGMPVVVSPFGAQWSAALTSAAARSLLGVTGPADSLIKGADTKSAALALPSKNTNFLLFVRGISALGDGKPHLLYWVPMTAQAAATPDDYVWQPDDFSTTTEQGQWWMFG